MKTYYFQKKPLSTTSWPRRAAAGPYAVSVARNTRADIRQILRGPLLQAKLTIGAPDDVYEQEADRVAEAVMSMPEPRLQTAPTCNTAVCPQVEEESIQPKSLPDQISPLVQRQVEEEDEEEELIQTKALNGTTDLAIQRQPEDEEEELLQTKQSADHTPEVTPHVASKIAAMQGRGQPLPASERAFFEPRFGRDFSQVRIHTGLQAAETARTVNAKAFTVGRNIVFGSSEYTPAGRLARQLLAHELTHVVQQARLSSRSHETIGRLVVPANSAAHRTDIGKPGFLQRMAIADEKPPSGTAEGEIEDLIKAKPPGTAEAPEADQPPRLNGQANPPAESAIEPTPAVKSVEFQEHPSQVYQGFSNDSGASIVSKHLVIPHGGGRKLAAKVEPLGAKPEFITLGPNPIEVMQKDGPDNIEVNGTSGGERGNPSEIKATDQDGNVLDRIGIWVLPSEEVSVGFHFMRDPPREKLFKNLPQGRTKRSPGDEENLTETLKKVWLPQANIRFSKHSAHEEEFKTRQIGSIGGSDDQLKQLLSPFSSGADMEVFLVWELRSSGDPMKDPNGRRIVGTNITILEDEDAADGFDIAHEAGHFLYEGPHTDSGLMAPTTGGPDRPRVQARVAIQANRRASTL